MAWDENLDGILEDFGSMLMDVNSTSYIDGFFWSKFVSGIIAELNPIQGPFKHHSKPHLWGSNVAVPFREGFSCVPGRWSQVSTRTMSFLYEWRIEWD